MDSGGRRAPTPGISRQARISEQGLARLEAQLLRGTGISSQVLAQWIRRYGEPARALIAAHGRLDDVLEALDRERPMCESGREESQ